VPPRASTGGGVPDPPTRLFALQKDVIAVAFGITLRAYDMRYVSSASCVDLSAERHMRSCGRVQARCVHAEHAS